MDRPETRPEIEPFTWDISSGQPLLWPVSAKEKPDLIIFDPPYFNKKRLSMVKKAFPVCPKNNTNRQKPEFEGLFHNRPSQ